MQWPDYISIVVWDTVGCKISWTFSLASSIVQCTCAWLTKYIICFLIKLRPIQSAKGLEAILQDHGFLIANTSKQCESGRANTVFVWVLPQTHWKGKQCLSAVGYIANI